MSKRSGVILVATLALVAARSATTTAQAVPAAGDRSRDGSSVVAGIEPTPTPFATPVPTPPPTPTSDPTPSPKPTLPFPPDPGTRDDFDGDGLSDSAVYDQAAGVWKVRGSTAGLTSTTFGGPVWLPAPGDYDGDGSTDVAVFRITNHQWWYLPSSFPFGGQQFDTSPAYAAAVAGGSWVPAPGDYDGDGGADAALYDETSGSWVIERTSDHGVTQVTLGGAGFQAVPADFDGDGKTDIAVYETAPGNWSYISSASTLRVDFQFAGGSRRVPVPADYDGDGRADAATYQRKKGKWRILPSTTGVAYTVLAIGGPGQVATPADFDGDGKVDPGAYRKSNGAWRYQSSVSGTTASLPSLGGPGKLPVVGRRP